MNMHSPTILLSVSMTVHFGKGRLKALRGQRCNHHLCIHIFFCQDKRISLVMIKSIQKIIVTLYFVTRIVKQVKLLLNFHILDQ